MLSTQQIFWSVAIVSSVLLVILLVLTLFDTEEEPENNQDSAATHPWFDSRIILLFLTLFGWFTVIGSYLHLSLQQNILFSILLSFSLAFVPSLLTGFRKRPSFELPPDLRGAILTTGQVLQPIPPHRNGFGKVQLDYRRLPIAMDAITAGQELQPGAPVRVVDVIDNRILVVEPLPDEIPPDGGRIRGNNEGGKG